MRDDELRWVLTDANPVVGYLHKGLACDDARLRTPSSRDKEQFLPLILTSREGREDAALRAVRAGGVPWLGHARRRNPQRRRSSSRP
jgi:hypothetical protein